MRSMRLNKLPNLLRQETSGLASQFHILFRLYAAHAASSDPAAAPAAAAAAAPAEPDSHADAHDAARDSSASRPRRRSRQLTPPTAAAPTAAAAPPASPLPVPPEAAFDRELFARPRLEQLCRAVLQRYTRRERAVVAAEGSVQSESEDGREVQAFTPVVVQVLNGFQEVTPAQVRAAPPRAALRAAADPGCRAVRCRPALAVPAAGRPHPLRQPRAALRAAWPVHRARAAGRRHAGARVRALATAGAPHCGGRPVLPPTYRTLHTTLCPYPPAAAAAVAAPTQPSDAAGGR